MDEPLGLPHVPGVEHRFVDAGGIRVHVAEAGSGAPLLLLHTTFQHWYAWHGLIPLLAERYRVICPDMRGCGWSDAPAEGYEKEALAADVLALLDALGLERAGLMAHGLGGLVGFLAALEAPERISRYMPIGIVHPWLQMDLALAAGLWRSWYQPLVATPGLGPRVAGARWFLRWLLRGTSPHPDSWGDDDIDVYARALAESARSEAMSLMYRAFLLRELVPLTRGRYRGRRLTVPTLLLFGAEDRFFSRRALRGYEPHAPEMRIEFLEGEGHFVHKERPELVATRALAFFRPMRG